eukprot:1761123-Rhodomonas_salina.1
MRQTWGQNAGVKGQNAGSNAQWAGPPWGQSGPRASAAAPPCTRTPSSPQLLARQPTQAYKHRSAS